MTPDQLTALDATVTQADRDAAASYFADIVPTMPLLAEIVSSNKTALSRAFARHRIAALRAQQPIGDVAGLVERLGEIAADAYTSGCVDVHNAWVNELGQIDPDFGEARSDYLIFVTPLIEATLSTLSRRVSQLEGEIAGWKKLHAENCAAYDSACADREYFRARTALGGTDAA